MGLSGAFSVRKCYSPSSHSNYRYPLMEIWSRFRINSTSYRRILLSSHSRAEFGESIDIFQVLLGLAVRPSCSTRRSDDRARCPTHPRSLRESGPASQHVYECLRHHHKSRVSRVFKELCTLKMVPKKMLDMTTLYSKRVD